MQGWLMDLHRSAPVSSGQGAQTCRERGVAQASGQPAGTTQGTVLPTPAWVRGYPLTVVVFALLQSLAEALTQGQVTLSGGAVQELLDLVGAGPHLQGLGARPGGSLEYGTGGSKVGSRLAPRSGLQCWGPPASPHTPSPGAPGLPGRLSDSGASLPCLVPAALRIRSPQPFQTNSADASAGMDSIFQFPHNGLTE